MLRIAGTHTVQTIENGMMTRILTERCFMCDQTGHIDVTPEEWRHFSQNPDLLVQQAFPGLTVSERDQLMTGMHVGECQDRFYNSIAAED